MHAKSSIFVYWRFILQEFHLFNQMGAIVLGHTFPKNMYFKVLTSTYSEFDADHENGLHFFGSAP